jgi:hypothetical protein
LAIVILVQEQISPGFRGEDGRRNANMAGRTGFEIEGLSGLVSLGNGIDGSDVREGGEIPGLRSPYPG